MPNIQKSEKNMIIFLAIALALLLWATQKQEIPNSDSGLEAHSIQGQSISDIDLEGWYAHRSNIEKNIIWIIGGVVAFIILLNMIFHEK